MKTITFAAAALSLLSAPVLAQDATARPRCSATVTDSCDQSKTTERYALTAEQADRIGGVGDRAVARHAAAKPRHHARRHRATHVTTTTTATAPR